MKNFAFRLSPDHEAKLKAIVKEFTGKDTLDAETFRLFIENYSQLPITDKEKPLETVNQKQPVKIKEVPDCHFRGFNPIRQEWFCDMRKVDFYACVNRQQRYLLNGLKCYPAHYGKNYITQKAPSKLIFDKNLRCTLRDRLVPMTYLPLPDCNKCPNDFCKEEIDRLLKSI